LRNINFCKKGEHKRFYALLYALCLPAEQILWQAGAMRVYWAMSKEKEDEFEEPKELFKEGLIKIFQATKKATEKIVEGFREGYAKDVTKKEK
jgi:hypothetical protein